MTSNLGTRMLGKTGSLGFQSEDSDYSVLGKMKASVQAELKKAFNPEFLNRIDDILVFHPLEKKHLEKIILILIQELNDKLLEKKISLDVSDELLHWLVQEGYDPIYGARPMRRCVQRNIEDPLSEQILKGRFKAGCSILATLKDNAPDFIEAEALAEV